jgi:hypothetical protein
LTAGAYRLPLAKVVENYTIFLFFLHAMRRVIKSGDSWCYDCPFGEKFIETALAGDE